MCLKAKCLTTHCAHLLPHEPGALGTSTITGAQIYAVRYSSLLFPRCSFCLEFPSTWPPYKLLLNFQSPDQVLSLWVSIPLCLNTSGSSIPAQHFGKFSARAITLLGSCFYSFLPLFHFPFFREFLKNKNPFLPFLVHRVTTSMFNITWHIVGAEYMLLN